MAREVELEIVDNTLGGHNVTARVDVRTARELAEKYDANVYKSRSKFMNHMLENLLEHQKGALALTVPEIQYWGRKRGPNAVEKDAMYQAHGPEIVRKVKLYQVATGLDRASIARCAIHLFLGHIPFGGAK